MPANNGFDRTFIHNFSIGCSFWISINFHDFAEACIQGGFYFVSWYRDVGRPLWL